MIKLNEAKIGRIYKIVKLDKNNCSVARRLMELGFLKGEKLCIESTSLQKKVMLLQIKGYLLSVRASLLESVIVE